MDISLRPVVDEDYDFLWQLNKSTMHSYVEQTWGWDEAWQVDHFNENFSARRGEIITVNGVDAGYLEVHRREDSVFLSNIQVASEFQNRGIGTRLVRNLTETSDKPVTLQVIKVNPARRLYERLGFVVTEDAGTYYNMEYRPE